MGVWNGGSSSSDQGNAPSSLEVDEENPEQECGQERTEEECLPECHMDYCFPGEEGGQKLVEVERHSKVKKAFVVPSKGRYAAEMVIDLIEDCGDKDRGIFVKRDQQPAVKFLVDGVCISRTRRQDDCRAGA